MDSLRFKLSNRRNEKFNRLFSKFYPTINVINSKCKNWVLNFSSRLLGYFEYELLQKGLNFLIGASKLDLSQVLAAVESAIKIHAPSVQHRLRTGVSKQILMYNYSSPTVRNLYLDDIKGLKTDNSIVISKADKGRIALL